MKYEPLKGREITIVKSLKMWGKDIEWLKLNHPDVYRKLQKLNKHKKT